MAGLLERIFAHFGSKKDGHDPKEAVQAYAGFSVKVAVPLQANGPVVSACLSGDGGVQGLSWYVDSLRTDEDGDVADEFWREVATSKNPGPDNGRLPPKLELVVSTRPALTGSVCTRHGNVHQCIQSADCLSGHSERRLTATKDVPVVRTKNLLWSSDVDSFHN